MSDEVPRFIKPSPGWYEQWPRYRKRHLTQAQRVDGPFEVETREGVLSCPDGYLAIDSQGNPYPIAVDEFEAIYERVSP